MSTDMTVTTPRATTTIATTTQTTARDANVPATVAGPPPDPSSLAARAWPVTARIGAVGMASFYLASLAAGAVKPGYSHLREAMSALAAIDSPGASVMIAGFLVGAAGMLAVGLGIRRRLRVGVAGPVAAGLMLLSSALMVVVGLARQDCSERLPSCIDHGDAPLASTHFWVHQHASLALFVLLTVAMLVMARGLRRSGGWAYLARWSKLAGLLSVLAIAELIVDPPVLNPYAGLIQRLWVLILLGWPLVVAAAPARPAPAVEAGTPGTPGTPGTLGESGTTGTARETVIREPVRLTPAWPGWIEHRRPGTPR
jgi:hypothetical membrane protein